MRKSLWCLGGLLAVLAVAAAGSRSGSGEVDRLRRHFATVEQELLARDVSGLSVEQRAARAEQVAVLRGYAARGVFPKNRDFPGQMVPYFRDADNTLCAMAFLIAESGRRDIVDHVALTRNNAYVPELVDEPGLAEWLDRHGLSVAEAARIQPSYGGCGVGFIGGCVAEPPQPSQAYVVASLTAGLLNGITIVGNARSLDRLRGRRWMGVLGVLSGGGAMALGVARVGKDGAWNTELGAFNLVSGAVAVVLGARSLFGAPRGSAPSRSPIRVVPTTTFGTGGGVGFEARLRF